MIYYMEETHKDIMVLLLLITASFLIMHYCKYQELLLWYSLGHSSILITYPTRVAVNTCSAIIVLLYGTYVYKEHYIKHSNDVRLAKELQIVMQSEIDSSVHSSPRTMAALKRAFQQDEQKK